MLFKKKAIALRLALVLSLIPVLPILGSSPAHADTAANLLCAKNASDGTNVDVSYIPGFCIVKFKSGTVSWTPPSGSSITNIQYLIVGGGGSGGRGDPSGAESGGGGGGGVQTGYTAVAPGTTYTIKVGSGGSGSGTNPASGDTSTAFSINAAGGGYGGYGNNPGGNGGSGGGGTHLKTSGGLGISGQGFAGETPVAQSSGGGGGGASAAGSKGVGGLGLGSAITGTTVFYGDGGGAGCYNRTDISGCSTGYKSRPGGSGNGGSGASAANVSPGNGVANTGGGGGGAYSGSSADKGGSGGSGVVIIRYAVTPSVNGLMGYFRNFTDSTFGAIDNPATTGPEYCHSGVYSTTLKDWVSNSPNSNNGTDINTSDGSDYGHDARACTVNNFVGFFNGYIKAPVTGDVTFTMNADDYYSLKIDSVTVVSLTSGNLGSSSATFKMQAGSIYPIQAYFQENTGSAFFEIKWSYSGQSAIVIPTQSLGTTVAALTTSIIQNAPCVIGSSQSCPAFSPQELVNLYGTTTDGAYWLMVNGVSTNVYMMMNSAFGGGGYVLAMKGANTGTTFGYDSVHWTNPTTLNPTGSGYVSRNSSDNNDAKFNTFNYLPASTIVATFPEWNGTSNSSYAAGPIGSNNNYGFSWRESMTANANTYLQLFGDTQSRSEIPNNNNIYQTVTRQKLRTLTDADIGKDPNASNAFFSRQAYVRWYGFNYVQMQWTTPSYGTQKVRWGFGNNENNSTVDGVVVGDEDSNDVNGGIGMSGFSSWSAGDVNRCCTDVSGKNSQTKFEMWLKMANPNLAAPTSVTTTTASNGNITVKWNKPTNTVPTEYVVQYSTSNTWDTATAVRVLMPGDSATASALITGLPTSQNYNFRVFARAQYNNTMLNSSVASSVVSRPSIVTNVRASALANSTTAITVSYDSVAGASSYTVKLYSDESATAQVGSDYSGFTSGQTISGLSPFTAYYAVVIANDSSGGGTSLTTTPVKVVTAGPNDYALDFNGTSQYVSGGATTDFAINGNIGLSMEAWVNPSVSTGERIVMYRQGSFGLKMSGGYWQFFFYGNSENWVDTRIEVAANEWHHIAVTRAANSGSAEFYVDGMNRKNTFNSSYGSGAATLQFNTSTYPMYIGRYQTAAGYFQGQIDEVKVWTSQRSQSQIQDDMNNYVVSATANPSLIAAFDFNEGTGSTLYNRVTNATTTSHLSVFETPTYQAVANTSTAGAFTVITFPRTYLSAIGWKVPAGTTKLFVNLLSGGGGGGGGATNGSAATSYLNGGGGGGGGGGEIKNGYLNTKNNETVTVIVGTGGAGGLAPGNTGNTAGLNGESGTPSKIIHAGTSSTTITAVGGLGGTGGGLSAGGAGGASGAGNAAGAANGLTGGGGGGAIAATGVNGARSDSITATGIHYGLGLTNVIAGGGGGTSGGNTAGTAGVNGGAGSGSVANPGSNAVYQKGAGGGGGAGSYVISGAAWGSARGGQGSTGVVQLKYLTSSTPSFTELQSSYTTTAGANIALSVSGTVPAPMTRIYSWQKSVDTGTSWSTISGATSETLTVTTYETSTSGASVLYRVTLYDSQTATQFLTDTATSVTYLVLNPKLTISGTTTFTRNYAAETTTATYTFGGGTGLRTASFSPTISGVTFSGTNETQTTLSLAKNLAAGTYYETITVTDSASAVANLMLTIQINGGGTITVQVDTVTALTYGDTSSYSPTSTITGLVNGDTATAANKVTYSYTYSSVGSTCATGGACSLGDTGPGGGKVFKVINSTYYEAAPKTWYTITSNSSNAALKYCADLSGNEINPHLPPSDTTDTTWGGGLTNTYAFTSYCPGGAVKLVSSYAGNGKTDWYIPNYIELDGLVGYLYDNNNLSQQFQSTTNVSFWSSNTTWTSGGFGWYIRTPKFDSNSYWNLSSYSYNLQGAYVIPIRKFTSVASSPVSVNGITDAGTYVITPSALTLDSPASTSNYTSVTYSPMTLVVNKATQSKIGLLQNYSGAKGTPRTLIRTGGSGTGTRTETLTASSLAAGCSLSGLTLTVSPTSITSCDVITSKAADTNYLIDSATVTVYLLDFVISVPQNNVGGGGEIGLNGQTAFQTLASAPPTVSSYTNSGLIGATLSFTGTGFVSGYTVTFQTADGGEVTATMNSVTSTSFSCVVPVGAVSGPIIVRNNIGIKRLSFTVTP